jgi:ABC-type multidrug transport system fused ATPase/permease subunit
VRVFGYLKQQRLSFVIGIILTIAIGGLYPIFSIFLSDIINSLFDLGSKNNRQSGRHEANIASLVFLILSVAGFIVTFGRDLLTYIVGD